MNDLNAITTINQADELFYNAQNELARPEEDVVGYMVCHNAYMSIRKYLTAFLNENGKEVSSSMAMEEILDLCESIDKKFKDLDLETLFNTTLKEDVYMDMSIVNQFINMAKATKDLVHQVA